MVGWRGVPPAEKVKQGIKYSAGGGLAAVLGALLLFLGAPEDTVWKDDAKPY